MSDWRKKLKFLSLGAGLFLSVSAPGLQDEINIRPLSRSECLALSKLTTNHLAWDDFVREVKGAYMHYEPTTPEDNHHFESVARKAAEQNSSALTFYHLENAPLRHLNNKVFKDREVSHVITNMFKKLVFDGIEHNEVLRTHLVGKYADFKTTRFAFKHDGEVYRAMEEVLSNARNSVAIYLNSHPAVVSRLAPHRPQGLNDPRYWFMGGFSASADGASYSARLARTKHTQDTPPDPMVVFENTETQKLLSLKFWRLENQRNQLERSLKGSQFMIKTEEGQWVPHPELVRILQSLEKENLPLFSLIAKAQPEIKVQFKDSLSAQDIILLSKYIQNVDSFSPSIFGPPPQTVELGQVKTGILWMDVAGQNKRNLTRSMAVLSKLANQPGLSKEARVNGTVQALRQGQDTESDIFDKTISVFKRLTHESSFKPDTSESPDGILISGDEGGFSVQRKPTHDDFSEFLIKLTNQTDIPPSQLRLIYLEVNDHNLSPLNVVQRAQIIKRAEQYEKEIRARLREKVSEEVLDKTAILLKIHLSGGKVNLNFQYATPPGTPSVKEPMINAINRGIWLDWFVGEPKDARKSIFGFN